MRRTSRARPSRARSSTSRISRVALTKLPPDQREALLLVGAAGLPYEDVAAIMNCAVGTVKSRVNRARLRLAQLLGLDGVEDLGPDRLTRAAIHTSA